MLTQKVKITKEGNNKETFKSYHKKLVLIKNNEKNLNLSFVEDSMPNADCNLNFWGAGPMNDELMF